ncbi:hypothetical protein ABK905_20045 [Acerihabitans sp. KWT182]|uniref:Uncharacterized protein n=1 Tax=Acerihabitans sp. KWT182 TaxID=3157919 RepID=A0AAU7Q7F6_9GAMM
MENLFDPATLCFDDVQCQCQALAYAAYKIEAEEVRELLIYTLMEKLQQLEKLLPSTHSPFSHAQR